MSESLPEPSTLLQFAQLVERELSSRGLLPNPKVDVSLRMALDELLDKRRVLKRERWLFGKKSRRNARLLVRAGARIRELKKERDHWKANHDSQLAIKRRLHGDFVAQRRLLYELAAAAGRYIECDERPRPTPLWSAMCDAQERAIIYHNTGELPADYPKGRWMTTRERAAQIMHAAVDPEWKALPFGQHSLSILGSELAMVDALIESGLLNDQRYEQVGGGFRFVLTDDSQSRHVLGEVMMGGWEDPSDVPVFRKVDVPGETAR